MQRTVVEVCTYRLSSLRGERPDNLRATKPVLWTRPIRGQQRVLQSSAHALLTPRNRFPTTLRSTASSALHIDAILSLSFLSLLDWTLINYVRTCDEVRERASAYSLPFEKTIEGIGNGASHVRLASTQNLVKTSARFSASIVSGFDSNSCAEFCTSISCPCPAACVPP